MNERLDLSHALDHARQLWLVNASSGPFCKIKSTGSSNILWLFLINIDYFMVGELVRFLFTSCGESQI